MLDSWEHLIPKFNGDQRRGIRRLRSPVLTELRHRLAGEQNWHCCYCGILMIPWDGSKCSASIDHVIPYSKGGKDDWLNLVAACLSCNIRKGNTDAYVFFDFKQSIFPCFKNQ